jgi:Carboxypeptidase regulatory-like domain/TonB dependent receptor
MRCLVSRKLGLALGSAALLAFATTLPAPAHAQVLYGSIIGNVADSSRAPVPGATVTITHRETNLSRESTTTADGNYRFVNVQPGTYRVRVALAGFKESVKENVPVSANAISRVDVGLEVGQLTETVTVQSEQKLLQTDSGSVTAELRSKEITSLPLGNYRNYQTLLNLVPGTTPAGFQNAVTDTPARALTTNVNGTARNSNNTRLDGTTNVFIWLPHHAVYVAPAETVETVNISTDNFDAEQGMAGGAAVTVLTKSGTNEFHGSAFALHENEKLRARNFFNNAPRDSPAFKSHRNIDGATLGGPIIRNRLFFFGAWEGTYEKTATTRTDTVPTAAQRAGDFSSFGTTIYDPATGNPDGSGRTPFPGNRIPANRISPIALALQSRLPPPNGPGTSGNYSATGPIDLKRNNFDGKLNYNVGSAGQVWAKYSQMNATVTSDMWLGNPQDGGAGSYGFGDGSGVGDTKVKLGTVGTTWTLSPNLVLDGTIGMTRFDQECIPPDIGTNFGTDVLHIPGTNGDGLSRGDPRTSGMPAFFVSGYADYGGVDGWSPLYRHDRSYNGSTNLTWTTSKHDMRFGVDIVRLELSHWQPELGEGPRGAFRFSGGATALGPSGSPDQFNAYAQFLLGLTTSVGKSVQFETMTGREWQYGLYFRDRWQVTKDLTLSLGLRWEAYPLMKRADRGIEYYDDNTNKVLLGGLGGNPEDLGIKVKHPHFLPRIGAAYRIGADNVLRGGYGVTVSPMPLSRPLRGFYPAIIAQNFAGPTDFVPFGTLASGIPLFGGPNLSSGAVDLPTSALMGSPYADHLNRGYIQSWNLTYERRLPAHFSLSTAYVGTKTTQLMGLYDINSAGAGQGRAGQPLFQKFGRTEALWRYDGYLSSNYHGLQLALNRPFTNGFFVKGAYTWSKAMNRQDDDAWATLDWPHPSVLSKNYGPAGYDRTHMFQLGFVAELPGGKNGSGPLNAIVRNWSLNGIFSYVTGTPFTVRASGASVNAPGNIQSADLVGTPSKLGGIGSGNPYYDPKAWAPVTEVRFGNTGRNTVRGPSWTNLDLSLFRRFPINRVNLEARIEAFNVTNTPHFNNPSDANRDVGSSGFMTITSAQGNERQIRLGLRLQF